MASVTVLPPRTSAFPPADTRETVDHRERRSAGLVRAVATSAAVVNQDVVGIHRSIQADSDGVFRVDMPRTTLALRGEFPDRAARRVDALR